MEFSESDLATLNGARSWFGKVVGSALANGQGPLIDDDLAHMTPWGFGPASITAPTRLLHGDRINPPTHSQWLATRIPNAKLRLTPGDGHISFGSRRVALDWLLTR